MNVMSFNSSRREVFILGAGFSRAIANGMPLMRELPKLVLDRYKLSHRLPKEFPAMFQENVEKALLFLQKADSNRSSELNSIFQTTFVEITRVIQALFIKLAIDPAVWGHNLPPLWLEALITYWHNHNSVVISFNYDTLIERVFSGQYWRNRSTSIPTGALYRIPMMEPVTGNINTSHQTPTSSLSTFTLLKLHGSANWFYAGNNELLNDDLLYMPCIGGIDGLFDKFEGRDPESEYWNVLKSKRPVIVPPVADKREFFANKHIIDQWNQAEKLLSESEIIHCLGYSLPESDRMVVDLLRKQLNSGARIQLVNLGNVEERYKSVLGITDHRVSQNEIGANGIQRFVINHCIPNDDDRCYVTRMTHVSSEVTS